MTQDHTMPSFERKGADALQRFFLYLILADFGLLILLWLFLDTLPLLYGSAVVLLQVGFNCLLLQLGRRRARRQSDTYILYPLIFATLCSLMLVLDFYFF